MVVTLVLTVLLAEAAPPRMLSVDASRSSVAYNIVHKLHKVRGESRQLQGKVALHPDGTVQVMIRAPVASFQSGDGNRDEHMRETMEDSKYPLVSFKGVSQLTSNAAANGAPPSTAELVLDGELDFHGQKRPVKIPVRVEFVAPGKAHVSSHFTVSLDEYHVHRPSLLFVKVDDACAVDLDMTLEETH